MTNETNEQKDFLESALYSGTPCRNKMYITSIKPANPDFDGNVYRESDLLFKQRHRIPKPATFESPYRVAACYDSGSVAIKEQNPDYDGSAIPSMCTSWPFS